MLKNIIQIDTKIFNDYLLNSDLKSYSELILELKKYYTITEILEIIEISRSTHTRYMENSCCISIRLHLDLLLKLKCSF